MSVPKELPETVWQSMASVLDADPAARAASLDALCARWPDLADSIREQAQGMWKVARAFAPASAEKTPQAVPAQVGSFQILGEIGAGGMGMVYLAEQRTPVWRRVALKVIKLGMDTKAVLARFDVERQALALMDHPSIARVYEAGATASGQPYFAMEYVKGTPITRYCDEHRLPLDERLLLFKQVCSGVQHAHQKGVIHRDLTPNNILVAQQDGKAAPKIIDFGLARATDHRLTAKTLYTEQGMVLGTPEYMSPEQAGGGAIDVDLRSDVYTLGVLLYELLTGELPFASQELRGAGYDAMCKTIREVDPPRPSTKVTTGRIGTESVAKLRRTDAHALLRRLRGDLDWIVMKCLEKDRDRRYETVSELAADVQRHLDHEPVLAHAPSAGYRLRKLVRRHRAQVFAVSAVLAASITGAIVAVNYALAAEASAAANALLAQEKSALAAGEAAAKEAAQRSAAAAERRAEELEQVLSFQEAQWASVDTVALGANLRRSLARADRVSTASSAPMGLAGINLTDVAVQMLHDNLFAPALAAIERGFGEQPLVKARLLHGVAVILQRLGLLDRARTPMAEALVIRRRLLGEEHPHTLRAMSDMSRLLCAEGKLAESERLHRDVLARHRQAFGDDHADTLTAICDLAGVLIEQGELDEAEVLCGEAMERTERVPDGPHRNTAMHQLSRLLVAQGKLAEAETMGRLVLETCRRTLGDDHPNTITAIHNLGVHLKKQGKLAEAEPFYREALDRRRAVLGDEHPDTWISIADSATLLQAQGKLAEAEPLCREALDRRRALLGDEHPHTLLSMTNMAALLIRQGKVAEAEPLCREALATGRKVLGDDNPKTIAAIANMGSVYLRQGKLGEAEALFREALARRRAVFGDDSPDTVMSIDNLGAVLVSQGRFAEAELVLREALSSARRVLGDDHPRTLNVVNNLGTLLANQGELTEAEPLLREVLERRRRFRGEEHIDTVRAVSQLGGLLARQEKPMEAEPLLRDATHKLAQMLGATHAETLLSTRLLGEVLVRAQRHAEAVAMLSEVEAAMRTTFSGGNAPQLAYFLTTLGDALCGAGRTQDLALAESKLLEAQALLASAVVPAEDTPACRALVALYEAWHGAEPSAGHDKRAAVWKARLASKSENDAGR